MKFCSAKPERAYAKNVDRIVLSTAPCVPFAGNESFSSNAEGNPSLSTTMCPVPVADLSCADWANDVHSSRYAMPLELSILSSRSKCAANALPSNPNA